MSEKYDVKMLKKIFGCSGEDGDSSIWLYHNFQLPFPPYPGLFIFHDGIQEVVDGVQWDLGSEMFTVFTVDDEEIKTAHLNNKSHRDEEEIVKDYLKMGWEID
jgi:hypothetical protein